MSTTVKTLVEKCRAGYPALYLLAPEDQRSIADVTEVAKQLNRKLFIWTFTKGIEDLNQTASSKGKQKGPVIIPDTENPPGALAAMEELPDESIILLRHFHHFMPDDPVVQIGLLDLIPKFKASKRMIVVATPVLKLPLELEKSFALVESELPNKDRLLEVLEGILKGLPSEVHPTADRKKHLCESAQGMTSEEAENAFSESFIKPKINKTGEAWDPNIVMDAKCQAIKKTGLLEYIQAEASMADVGGMKLLKDWVQKRGKAFSEEAKKFGLPSPKGVLLVGPPGSGKSLAAKAVSNALVLPLIRMDVGALLGSLVGESEANIRRAIQILEANAPCVAWVDEVEKAFAGAGSSLDSGVSARIFGKFLTWMQEKKAPVFVVATANNVKALPPEFLRKGRFDELFAVTLPNKDERAEIFRIHLRKRKREGLAVDREGQQTSAKQIVIEHVVKATEGFSGAEIEATIVEAMFTSYAAGSDLNMMDLVDAIDNTVPLSKMMAADITAMMEWCKTHARPANGEEITLSPGVTRKLDA